MLGVSRLLAAAEPSIEARLEPTRLGIEDTARLTVTIWEGGKVIPKLGELENFEVLYGPATESHFRWVNAVASNSVGFVYTLKPLHVGAAAVGSITAAVGDVVLATEEISAQVVEGSVVMGPQPRRLPVRSWDPFQEALESRRPGARHEASIVLRHLVDKAAPFLGEPVVATLVLDTNVAGVKSFELTAALTFPGWWTQKVTSNDPAQAEIVEVDGIRYYRYRLANHVLIPLRHGELKLPPVTARIGIRAPAVFAREQQIERSTEEIRVPVQERPQPPPEFAGGVGTLTYSARLEPTRIELGESAVLTIELSGSGNLPLVGEPPMWPRCDGCDSYPPEEESQIEVDATGIHGTRTWRTTIVPRKAGDLRLDPVILAFFDPGVGSYRRQPIGAMLLAVEPPPATPVPIPAAPAAAVAQGSGSGAPASSRQPHGVGWLWIAAALLVGLAGGSLSTWLLVRRQSNAIPARRPGQSPADRARELQLALERWRIGIDENTADDLTEQLEQLRKQLETVRFAPGRADHSETIRNLEDRMRRLMRRTW
jgi:hypothetical protein